MLKSFILSCILICITLLSYGQDSKTAVIYGFAPAYIGKTVEIYEIQDFISFTEKVIATSVVAADSTFKIEFPCKKTQKIIIRSNKNKAFLYIQPKGSYEVYLPEKDKYDPYRPNGNTVELSFYNLDSLDINYKILGFQRWEDDFLGTYFYAKNAKGVEFAVQLEKFKTNVEKAYASDTNTFFKTFVKFSVASLDEIQQAASRNRYEKHDFYIKHSTVSYDNDAYMAYISKFYEGLNSRLTMETANDVYLGVLKSSPTRVMKALGGEYTLLNWRIREMIMIKMLSEVFYSGDFPQSNILTIMDSVTNHAMFEATKVISRNVKARLVELVPGGKAPDFSLTLKDGTVKTLPSYEKKHVYIHFLDPSNIENLTEIPLLVALQAKYVNDIQFITVYKKQDSYTEQEKKVLATITWDAFEIVESDPILTNYQILTYSSYVLIDGYGYIVSSPALGPLPNGEGVTIDKTFNAIHKLNTAPK